MRKLTLGPTVVVGASRGLGRATVVAFAESGADVVAVARNESDIAELAAATSKISYEAADAAAEGTAEWLIGRHDPSTVVLVAGATPHMSPLHEQTWESFSVNWETDVRMTFHWLRAILRAPLRPCSRVLVVSSAAALAGSPLSGGYAGAKATQRFITAYARGESERAVLGIDFTTVAPRPVPATAIGKAAIAAYARQSGVSEDAFIEKMGGALTPETAAAALVELAQFEPENLAEGYLLDAAGLHKIA